MNFTIFKNLSDWVANNLSTSRAARPSMLAVSTEIHFQSCLRRKVYSHLRRFLWWWHGNHRDFVTFCRHCEPLLCSQVAFQAYEDVPNPTKKKMGQKWRRTKTQARKWYHHVFTAFFQCYCMQPRLQMALLKVKLVFFSWYVQWDFLSDFQAVWCPIGGKANQCATSFRFLCEKWVNGALMTMTKLFLNSWEKETMVSSSWWQIDEEWLKKRVLTVVVVDVSQQGS